MKIRSIAKIFVLALSLVLLMTAAIGLTASAEGEGSGDIYSTTIVHNDKISIAIAVKATAAEIADGTVVVNYTWDGSDVVKTATYREAHASQEGYVWVVTEGVAAYDLALNANITTYYNGEVVETGAYSVATFLYNKLYKDGVDGEAKACYEALLAYGATSQAYLDKNADTPVNALNYAYTKTAGVKINGKTSALGDQVTLTYDGDHVIEGWVVDGETYSLTQTAFDINGVVEIGVVYAEDLTITFSKGSFTAETGKWAYNKNVSPIWNYEVVIYDNTFTGTLIADSYGMAYVLGSDGNLKALYDGYNGSYYYGATDGTRTKFSGNYVTVAFNTLAEGDMLIVLPRYYPNSTTMNPAVTWAQSIRWTSFLGNDQYTGSPVGQEATLTYTPATK